MLGLPKHEGDTERIAKKTKQGSRDEAGARRARRNDITVEGTVVTAVQWAIFQDFGWASKAVINGTGFCASGRNYMGKIFCKSMLNGRGLVGDRVNIHAPVGLLYAIYP